MNSTPPVPASQHGMIMTLPPGSLGPDGALRSAEAGLPVGTRLGEFEVTGLIGEGGFGIVYMATDHLLGRQVALKEYMPSALASRGAQAQVSVKSDRHADTFEAGRRSFINEARLLAQFDHPALVKVFRFWEANGTAYMVMPYYRGRTLRQALAEMAAPPSQPWLQRILLPLMDALETLHAAQCYHRDIAPDNILLLDNGAPVLLDFGAARRVIGDITQALTVILKPGFAPVEQYANGPEMRQGPWTDVYALAAVIYYCATLKTPVPAVSRMMKDTLEPFGKLARDRYDPQFCEAVDRGLAVTVEERIQGVVEFREALGIDAGATGATSIGGSRSAAGSPGAAAGFGGTGDLEATIVDTAALQRARRGEPGRRHNSPPLRGIAEDIMNDSARASQPAKAEKPWTPNADVQMERLAAEAAQSADRGGTGPWIPVAALAVLLAAGAGGFWYWNQSVDTTKQAGPVPQGASPASPAGGPPPLTSMPPPPAALSSPGTSPPPAPFTPPPAQPAPPQMSAPPVAPPATVAAPPPLAPFPSAPLSAAPTPAPPPVPPMVPSLIPQLIPEPTPTPGLGAPGPSAFLDNAPLPVGRIIDSLHEQRDPGWPVSVQVKSDRVRIGKDRLSFRLRSERDGYVYLLMQGTDRSHFYQLFPNGLDKNNRLRGKTDMSLPRSNWEMVAGGPAGLNRFIALVTPSPRNFASAGLGGSQPFSEFDPQIASRVFADKGAAPFAGEPAGCKLGEQACGVYGAVLFEIEEY